MTDRYIIVATGQTGPSGAGNVALDDLSDVTITAGASGDILRHNGTAWVDTPGTTHFDAAGAATTAQAAAEATAAAALSAHTGDTTDAHAASAITFTPSGNIAATDVQSAVAEVATDAASALSTHEADTTSVHGISNTADIVLRTIVDAKGDIIAATAADTFARVAVGTDGQVLTADAASAAGVKWAAVSAAASPPVPIPPGFYHNGLLYQTRVATGLALVADRVYVQLAYIPTSFTIDDMAIIVTTGAASSTAQVGIYSCDSTFAIGSRLAVVTGLDTSTTGTKSGSVSLAVTAGFYWLACVATGGTPSTRQVTTGIPFGNAAVQDHVFHAMGYGATSQSSLPSAGSSIGALTTTVGGPVPVPLVQFRRAA